MTAPDRAPWPLALVEPVLDLVLDRSCAGCGEGTRPLCRACASALRRPPAATLPRSPGCPPTWAAAAYEGPVRALLLAYKEHGQHALAGPLGSALAHAVAGASAGLSGPVLLVPVPSGTLTVLRRGDDVVGALAGTAARTARAGGLPVRRASALRQAGRRRDQVGLGRLERRANMVGAFEVRPRLRATVRGAQVVVVDDIVTSGATLAAAARVLASAGAHVVAGAVVAATPARG